MNSLLQALYFTNYFRKVIKKTKQNKTKQKKHYNYDDYYLIYIQN